MRKDLRTIPFRDMASVMLSRSLAKPGTVRDYERLLRHADPVLGALRCGDVEQGDVRSALASIREEAGLSPKSLANVRGVIRLVLAEAGCAASVAAGVKIPQEPRKARALGSSDSRRLVETLDRDGGLCERALQALLGTGLRLGELLDLTADDVDLAEKRLRVAGRKTAQAGRGVDIPDWALDCFRRGETGDGPLFDVTPKRLRAALDRALRAADLPRLRLHDLRHTRLTCLLLAGAPVLYVSKQAGHSSPAYTMRAYGHVLAATTEERRHWCNL